MIVALLAIVAAIGIVAATVVLFFCAIFWRAWWLLPAWAWFAVPLGLPPLSYTQFLGLLALVAVFWPSRVNKKGEKDDNNALIANVTLSPPLYWVLLYTLHWGMMTWK